MNWCVVNGSLIFLKWSINTSLVVYVLYIFHIVNSFPIFESDQLCDSWTTGLHKILRLLETFFFRRWELKNILQKSLNYPFPVAPHWGSRTHFKEWKFLSRYCKHAYSHILLRFFSLSVTNLSSPFSVVQITKTKKKKQKQN